MSWDLQVPVFTGAGGGDGDHDVVGCGENSAKVIGGKLKDGEAPTREILLISEVLIRSNEEIEFLLCQTDEVAVFDSAPAPPLRGGTVMSFQQLVHGPWHALVEQYLHATARRTDSDFSSRARAASRLTEGKHSTNSPRV